MTQAVLLAELSFAALTALAVLFSSLSTPILSSLYTLASTRSAAGRGPARLRQDPGRRPRRDADGAVLRLAQSRRCSTRASRWPTPSRCRSLQIGSRRGLRGVLRRRGAGARGGGLRSPGVQVSAPAARLAAVGARASSSWLRRRRPPGAGCQAGAVLPRGRALEELAYYPSGQWLVPARWASAPRLPISPGCAPCSTTASIATATTRSRFWPTCSTSSPARRRHRNAYVFGGTSLAQEGRQFEAGMALLEKGRRQQSREPGSIPSRSAFLHFVEQRDCATATLWFREAARKPGAPDYVRASPPTRLGPAPANQAQALELWQRVAEETDEPVAAREGGVRGEAPGARPDLAPAVSAGPAVWLSILFPGSADRASGFSGRVEAAGAGPRPALRRRPR